jgi:CheY-like chemotaxis protein
VGDGKAVLDALENRTYDLVLLDCQMPVMDGFEAVAALRERESRREHAGIPSHVPVVAVTANALAGERERCHAAGMDDYVSKPIAPARLLAAMAKWLPAAEGNEGAATPLRGAILDPPHVAS